MSSTEQLAQALEGLLRTNEEAAGFTPAILADKDGLKKFLDECDVRVNLARAKAREALAAYRAQPAASSAQEPTDAMKVAGAREILMSEVPAVSWEDKAARVFMAMLAAAPARMAGAAQGEVQRPIGWASPALVEALLKGGFAPPDNPTYKFAAHMREGFETPLYVHQQAQAEAPRQPLSYLEIERGRCEFGGERADFTAGVRFAEAKHSIGADGEKGGA